jgi:hypothetical protein
MPEIRPSISVRRSSSSASRPACLSLENRRNSSGPMARYGGTHHALPLTGAGGSRSPAAPPRICSVRSRCCTIRISIAQAAGPPSAGSSNIVGGGADLRSSILRGSHPEARSSTENPCSASWFQKRGRQKRSKSFAPSADRRRLCAKSTRFAAPSAPSAIMSASIKAVFPQSFFPTIRFTRAKPSMSSRRSPRKPSTVAASIMPRTLPDRSAGAQHRQAADHGPGAAAPRPSRAGPSSTPGTPMDAGRPNPG